MLDINLSDTKIALEQRTGYPWEGEIEIRLEPERKKRFVLALRIPGWSVNQPIPGDLYTVENRKSEQPRLTVNQQLIPVEMRSGYVFIDRFWEQGDIALLELPLEVLKIISHPAISANVDKVALQIGPFVYCLEGVDNDIPLNQIFLTPDTPLKSRENEFFGGIHTIQFYSGQAVCEAIPYFLWSNRGVNEMEVWIDYHK
jgi:DUF1680 family protein